MNSMVMMGEKVKPKGEIDNFSIFFQRLNKVLKLGKLRGVFIKIKNKTEITIVTPWPMMVAKAAPAIPQFIIQIKV